MTNVIKFPDLKKKQETKETEKVESATMLVEEVCDELLSNMVADLIEIDMDITGDKYVYDVSYVYEVLRSVLLKYHGIHHPVQLISEGIYKGVLDDEQYTQEQLEFDF